MHKPSASDSNACTVGKDKLTAHPCMDAFRLNALYCQLGGFLRHQNVNPFSYTNLFKRYLGSLETQQEAYRSDQRLQPIVCLVILTIQLKTCGRPGSQHRHTAVGLWHHQAFICANCQKFDCLHTCRIKKEQSAKEVADKKHTPAAAKPARDSAASSAKPKQRRQTGVDKTEKDVHHVLYKVIGQVGLPSCIKSHSKSMLGGLSRPKSVLAAS